MNLVDSSGWVEYFIEGPLAGRVAPYCQDAQNVLVPSVVLFETYKKILREVNRGEARQAWLALRQGRIVPVDVRSALRAALYGLRYKLPAMDSLIYAVARRHDARLITLDDHFRGLPRVVYLQNA